MSHTVTSRRLVGTALRRYREARGYTLDMSASLLECNRSKISRIETGQRGIHSFELRALLEEYGVVGAERAVLAALARPRYRVDWWDQYRTLLPAAYLDYLFMESAASRIAIFDALHLPDLVQTADYARAIASALPGASSAEEAVDARVEGTLRHQEAVLEDQHPEIRLILTEGALRHQVGDAGIMRAQLAHLAEFVEGHPKTIVQVLPFTHGADVASGASSMRILTFAETLHLGSVYIPGPSGGIGLEDDDVVALYAAAFDRIHAAALSPEESLHWIKG